MINVDLLIRDDTDRTLLTWRHDAFYGPGWHVPGGIIRFKESAANRIAAVAQGELGTKVELRQHTTGHLRDHQPETRRARPLHFAAVPLHPCSTTR